eukprot:3989764-Karenia_brevis.AAC.1
MSSSGRASSGILASMRSSSGVMVARDLCAMMLRWISSRERTGVASIASVTFAFTRLPLVASKRSDLSQRSLISSSARRVAAWP